MFKPPRNPYDPYNYDYGYGDNNFRPPKSAPTTSRELNMQEASMSVGEFFGMIGGGLDSYGRGVEVIGNDSLTIGANLTATTDEAHSLWKGEEKRNVLQKSMAMALLGMGGYALAMEYGTATALSKMGQASLFGGGVGAIAGETEAMKLSKAFYDRIKPYLETPVDDDGQIIYWENPNKYYTEEEEKQYQDIINREIDLAINEAIATDQADVGRWLNENRDVISTQIYQPSEDASLDQIFKL